MTVTDPVQSILLMVYESVLMNKVTVDIYLYFLPRILTLEERKKASIDTLAVTVLSGRLLKDTLTSF